MELTDICCNLTHESFDADRESVLQRARDAGVTRFLIAGASLAESQACVELAGEHSDCWAAVGVHPHQAREWQPDSADILRRLSAAPRVVAIGECGLDYYRDLSPRSAQQLAFQAQLELAGTLELPALLHNRDADEDFLSIFDAASPRPPRVVLHCFTGGSSLLQACLQRGMYIGVTGWLCDERRGQALREAVTEVPRDRLLLETDAPYLLPRTLRPRPKTRRNEPMWLPHIAEQAAALLDIPVDELAAQTQSAAQEFFAFPSNN